jgi:hypothetical protein
MIRNEERTTQTQLGGQENYTAKICYLKAIHFEEKNNINFMSWELIF